MTTILLIVLGTTCSLAFVASVIFFAGTAPGAKRRDALLSLTRLALVVLGVFGAMLRAFPITPHKDDAYPVIDLTTLAFFSLVLVAFLLPRLKGVTFGKTTIDLTDAVDQLTDASDKTASLVHNWMFSLGYLRSQIQASDDAANIKLLFWNFVRDRLGDAKQEMSSSSEDAVRVIFWIHDERTDELAFAFSNEIDDEPTMRKRFGRLEGLVGQAFDEQRFWNEGEATTLPSFVPIKPRGTTGYTVVAAAPVSLFHERLGMLTFDKATEGKFDERASKIALAAARMIAIAFSEFETRLDELGSWT